MRLSQTSSKQCHHSEDDVWLSLLGLQPAAAGQRDDVKDDGATVAAAGSTCSARRPGRSAASRRRRRGGEQRARLGHRRRVALSAQRQKGSGREEAALGGRSSGLAAGARRPPHLDSGDSERAARTCLPARLGARWGGGAGLGLRRVWVSSTLPASGFVGASGSHSLVSPSHLVPSHPTLFLLSASRCTHFNLRITSYVFNPEVGSWSDLQ